MKIVSLELKRIGVGKFFPKQDDVELHIMFNDGADKEIFRFVNVLDSEKAAENILADLRKMERAIHKNSSEEPISGNLVNIVVKNEEKLLEEISRFIGNVKNKIDDIKKKDVAEGYLDIIRELKGLKVEF